MFGHNRQPVPAALFEGFKSEGASSEAGEEFRGNLIVAYEQALEQGIAPVCALATMLDVISQEFKRSISTDGNVDRP